MKSSAPRPAASCTASNSTRWAPPTNSDSGVSSLEHCLPVLEKMAEVGLPFLLHGEVTDPDIDIFDREAVFIERTWPR